MKVGDGSEGQQRRRWARAAVNFVGGELSSDMLFWLRLEKRGMEGTGEKGTGGAADGEAVEESAGGETRGRRRREDAVPT